MGFIAFLQTTPGRVLRVVMGVALLWAGAMEDSMAGLLLMMIGLIPVVTGIANVCPLADARDIGARMARTPHHHVPAGRKR